MRNEARATVPAQPDLLPRAFYDRPVLEVARDLLGRRIVRSRGKGRPLAGRIVEVEAYDGPDDKACHASRGLTKRTAPMFGEPGHAYIYLVYGMHHCLNIVTGPPGYPAAVLIRALAIEEGPERTASGPGLLTRAFGIALELNRTDLCAPGPLVVADGEPVPPRRIVRGPRIGVAYAGAWARRPWRFAIRGHPSVSRPF